VASWNSSQRLSWLTRIRSEGRQYCHWGRERLLGDIGRASACYVLIYDGGRASEVFFAGWSAD